MSQWLYLNKLKRWSPEYGVHSLPKLHCYTYYPIMRYLYCILLHAWPILLLDIQLCNIHIAFCYMNVTFGYIRKRDILLRYIDMIFCEMNCGSYLYYATLHYAIWVFHSARRILLGSISFYEWTGTPTGAPPYGQMLLPISTVC